MADETIQPARIDRREYELFKEFVTETHGKTRGYLSNEIENALREYRKDDNSSGSLTRIEDDIATIKAQITADSDGGSVAAPPSTDSTHAHADNTTTDDAPDQKPPANAPRSEKVAYLIHMKYDRDGGSVTVDTIIDDIKSIYHFEDRTAEKFVQPVIDELNAKRHPRNASIIAWGFEIEKVIPEPDERDD